MNERLESLEVMVDTRKIELNTENWVVEDQLTIELAIVNVIS